MATKQAVTKVWIEPGCIVCDACETAAPAVFQVTDDTCVIRPEALNPAFLKPLSAAIMDAASECPVDVIKYEAVAVEAAEAPPKPEAPPKAPAPKAPARIPAEPPKAPPVKSPAAPPKVSVAAEGDPSIQALLRAATSRGGSAGILRAAASLPEPVRELKRKDPSELPPDARQARVIEAVQKAKQDPDKQRRAFVGGAALTVGWLAFGVGTGTSVGPAFVRFMMPNVLEESDPRIRVGKLQRYMELNPGDVVEDFKPQGIWMIREEERIAALNIICTHLGCIPNWLPNDRKFKCPCHGSGYFPNGVNFEGPTPRPLERFRIYVEDGIVVVDKSKKYQYELGQWEMPGSFIPV
jgi:cytochrome b6-f complex iron-sulfur subunit